MQLSIHSDHMWLKKDSVAAARQEHTRAAPPRPNAGAHPDGVSAPLGLAFEARDGLAYAVRRVTPADVRLLDEFMYRLSAKSRRLRFMTARPCSPEFVRAQVSRMLAGAAGSSITLVVTDARGGSGAVAVAELACNREGGAGEVAVVVMDDAQRKGIGSMLLRQLLQIAQALGLAQLHGDMVAENHVMRGLIRALGLPYRATIESGEMHVVVQVPQ